MRNTLRGDEGCRMTEDVPALNLVLNRPAIASPWASEMHLRGTAGTAT